MSLQHTLRALADPIRRDILNLLKEGRKSAGEIADRFPVTAASISRHLSVLKEADPGGKVYLLYPERLGFRGDHALGHGFERR